MTDIAEARRKLRAVNFAKVGFEPNAYQQPIFDDMHRVKLIAGGEGAGKSYVTAAIGLGLYPAWRLAYIVGPKYQSCRPEFDYIADWLVTMKECDTGHISAPVSGAAMLKTPYGCTLQTITAEDGPNAITGTGKSPDLIMLVEAGKVPYEIFLACRNRVGRTKGMLVVSGTFEGSEGWYPEYFQRWQADNPEGAISFSLPTWTNTAIYPGGENDPEILALKATNPPDYFQERFGAIPCKPTTLVFPDFEYSKHVAPCPYWLADPVALKTPVELAVDIGSYHAYAILAIQRIDDRVYVIDELYERGKTTEQMLLLARERPWWHLWKGRGVIDIAARQRQQGYPAGIEEWRRLTGYVLESNKVGIADGIRRMHGFLFSPVAAGPRIQFDPRVKNTLWEFAKGYKYREVVDGRPVHEDPIDVNNDAIKALTYYIYAKFGPAEVSVRKLRKRKKPSPWARVLND